MKPSTLILLVVTIGCGATAAFMAKQFLEQRNQAGEADTVKVFVTTKRIEQGTEIIPELMVKEVDYPKDKVPKDAITSIEAITKRTVRHTHEIDEIIRDAKLAKHGEMKLLAVLGPGMRGLTLNIDTKRALAGLMKPGDHVDIMLTNQGRGDLPAQTMTILQDIKVLAVNSDISAGDETNKGRTVEMVTFEFTAEQAEKAALAQSQGELSLVARLPGKDNDVETSGASVSALFGRAAKKPDEASPESVIAQPTEKKEELGFFAQLAKAAAEAGKNQPPAVKPEETEKPEKVEQPKQDAPVTPTVAVPEVPRKKQKRLVYRDLQGNSLFEILVDADSPIAITLKDQVEDVNDEDTASSSDPAKEPAQPEAKKPEPKKDPKAAPEKAKVAGSKK